MYDMIIIGGGPAGITAAIYAARRKIKFLIISMDIGGQMAWSTDVENYPGFHLLSGIELTQKFDEHLRDYNIKLKTEEVYDIKRNGKNFSVITKNNSYSTKTVLIASGKKPRKLNVPGEDNYLKKGVSYCVTCDGPIFKSKTVAVIGGGNSGLDGALFLSNYAKKVYLIDIMKKLSGDKILIEKVRKNKKIFIITGAKTTKILGNKFVNGLRYLKENKEFELKVEGIFIEIGLESNADFAKIVKKNKWGEIKIKRSTKTHEENMTNIKGIYAAGDVTDIPAKQIVAAAGEGCKAILAAIDYINKTK